MTAETTEQTYAIIYQVKSADPPLAKAQIQALGPEWGGADALVVHDILFPPDGSRSEMIVSRDSRTGKPVDDFELFKCFTSLAYQLKDSTELGPGRREVCRRLWELVRGAVLAGRRAAEGGKK